MKGRAVGEQWGFAVPRSAAGCCCCGRTTRNPAGPGPRRRSRTNRPYREPRAQHRPGHAPAPAPSSPHLCCRRSLGLRLRGGRRRRRPVALHLLLLLLLDLLRPLLLLLVHLADPQRPHARQRQQVQEGLDDGRRKLLERKGGGVRTAGGGGAQGAVVVVGCREHQKVAVAGGRGGGPEQGRQWQARLTERGAAAEYRKGRVREGGSGGGGSASMHTCTHARMQPTSRTLHGQAQAQARVYVPRPGATARETGGARPPHTPQCTQYNTGEHCTRHRTCGTLYSASSRSCGG